MFKLAFKNIFRYKLRSVLTMIVIMVSAFASVLSMGFYQGIVDLFLSGYINYQTGHIRITTQEFLENQRFLPVYENLENISDFVDELSSNPSIKQIIPTYKFYGLFGNGDTTLQGSIIALDFQNNSYDFPKNLVSGSIPQTGILMGEVLRQKLSINLGDKLLIAGNTVEGGLNAIKGAVSGTYNYGMKLLDRQNVFLDLSTAQHLLKSANSATEIYIFLHDINNVDVITKQLQAQYPNLAIESYKTQMGTMYVLMEIQKMIVGLITAFVMFLGSLIIVNSLLASIYERMPEIGMMKAIGFTDKELSSIFFYEGGIFGILGGVLGFFTGIGFIKYFKQVGIDMTAILAETNLPMSATLYPDISILNMIICFVIVVFVPACVALIPAQHIKKILPIQALNSLN